MKNKKALAILLAAGMLLAGLAGCGAAPESGEHVGDEGKTRQEEGGDGESGQSDHDGIVTLKVLSLPSNTSGPVEGWWADILRKEAGVELEILPSGNEGEQKLQALMTSGELPDIVVFKDNKQVENAVAGDMLLAYDDYKELLPDLYANAEKSLRYYSDNVSNGQGRAYSVGSRIVNTLPGKGTLNNGPYLRYDIYKQIGSPEIKTSDDYLGVLKQMAEAYPENGDGQKVYAFSIWSDWDNTRMVVGETLGNINGVAYDVCGAFQELDLETNELTSILDENSWYQRNMKLYFDANQLGLLDPDSLTQRFDDATAKAGAGRTLFSAIGWATGGFDSTENHEKGIGFMVVPAENAKVTHSGLAPIGVNWSMSVSSATRHPEAAMKFVNFFYSEEGTMQLYNGPRGTIWDLDENGKPYVTEEGYKYMLDGGRELPGGGTISEALNYINTKAFDSFEICPRYGVPYDYQYWDKMEYAPADTKLADEWQADYGAEDQVDYLTQHDGIAVAPFAPIPPLPDDLQQITSRVGEVIVTYSWKMIVAGDEAEFEQLRREMTEKAVGMGIDKVNEWYAAEFEKAYELGQNYS